MVNKVTLTIWNGSLSLKFNLLPFWKRDVLIKPEGQNLLNEFTSENDPEALRDQRSGMEWGYLLRGFRR